MVIKDADDRSEDIAVLKGLRDNSPDAFRGAIQKQIDNIYSGMAGEREAAHFLNREYRHSEKIIVLHDLRLGVDGDFAQIDHLVIHRFQMAAWVLETKNFAGRLTCDEHGDWTVWLNGKPRSIQSPVNQARRHCQTLQLWMEANGIKAIHQTHPVVLLSPTSSVNRTNLPPDSHVIKSDNFPEWWRKHANDISIGNVFGLVGRHLLNGMSHDQFLALGQRLVDAHVPARYNWRAMLRLPVPKRSSEPSEGGPPEKAIVAAQGNGEAPLIIATAFGEVKIVRIPDGRYAIRNDKNDALIEIVRTACKGKAQWNPRYRNWLAAEDKLQSIMDAIKK